jgi:hypothetical protein
MDLRGWITVMAVACLAAGAGAGVLIGRSMTPPPRVERTGAFPDYQRLMAQTFELSPERREALAAILSSYEKELASIKDRHMADYMSSIEPELRERGAFYRALVRDQVLPAERRAEFDRLSQAMPAETRFPDTTRR